MREHDFTALLISYRNGSTDKKELVEAISMFVYKFPMRVYKWKEDDCSDFFSYFFPKISKMIETFEIRDIPFEAYLVKTLKLQIKTFAAKKTAYEISMRILRNKEFWEHENQGDSPFCSESGTEYKGSESGIISGFLSDILSHSKPGITRDSTLKKRMLMLTLKNMQAVQESEIAAVSAILDCDSKWLLSAIESLNNMRMEKTGRRKMLDERRNRHFCRLCMLHENFCMAASLEEKEKLYSDIARAKSSIDKIARKIDMIPTGPTHQDIAEVMNIPKGSVDSGLFYLKLYLEK